MPLCHVEGVSLEQVTAEITDLETQSRRRLTTLRALKRALEAEAEAEEKKADSDE